MEAARLCVSSLLPEVPAQLPEDRVVVELQAPLASSLETPSLCVTQTSLNLVLPCTLHVFGPGHLQGQVLSLGAATGPSLHSWLFLKK